MSTTDLPPSLSNKSSMRLLQIVLGIVSIFAGTLIGLLMFRGLLFTGNLKSTPWNIAGVFVFCLLGVYLIWIGSRAVRRGRGLVVAAPTIRWGRMLGGIWLVFFSVRAYVERDPAFAASNRGDTHSMLMVTLLMITAGIALIVVSLKPLLHKTSHQA